jgi:DHA3 family macrolide efflux protein-like MFS transporter
LRHWKKTFAIIWAGQLFSTLSSAVVGYAVMFWMSLKTGSAEVLAFAAIAGLLPQMLLGPFTGVLIDRWDRRRTMIWADAFVALCTAVLAVLFVLGRAELGHVYALLALRSLGGAFHWPAMQASIPLLVPEAALMRIAGANQVLISIATILGPALAALLINVLDMTWVLLSDVVGAAIACGTLLFIRIPRPERKEDARGPGLFREMRAGLKEITGRPGLFWLFVFVMAAYFFLIPLSALFPLMTLKHFAGGAYEMSLIEVAWGAGMLLGGAAMGVLKLKTNKVVLINAMYILLGAAFGLSGFLRPGGFAVFAGLTLAGGIMWAVFSGAFTVVMQTTIEPAALGRAYSIFGSVISAPAMFGLLQTGFIADRVGIPNAFIIAGAAFILIGAGSFFVRPIREMMRGGSPRPA